MFYSLSLPFFCQYGIKKLYVEKENKDKVPFIYYSGRFLEHTAVIQNGFNIFIAHLGKQDRKVCK